MQQKIKVIVFDFDNTLYIGDIWTNLKEYMLERLESFLDKEEAERILNESMELSGGKVKNDTIAFLVKQNGYEPKKLSDSIANNIYLHPNKVEVISNEFLKKLSEIYRLYCVSMSDQNYLKFYFEKYKIDTKYFNGIYSANFLLKDSSKTPILKEIIKKENISPEELLMIGDSFSHDIEPAKKLNCQTLYFTEENFNQMYDFFTENGLLNCEKYKK